MELVIDATGGTRADRDRLSGLAARRLSALLVARKVVRPMQGVGDKDMIVGQRFVRLREAAGGHVDLVRSIVVGERQLRAAARAERARAVRRGTQAGRLAGG